MNRMLLFVIGGVVVVAGIVVIVMSTHRSGTPSTTGATNQAQTASDMSRPTTEATSGDVNGSLSDLLTMGGNKKCEWSGTAGGQTMNGIVYISGKNMLSEAKTTLPSVGPFTAYVIGDGTKMTMWTSMAPAQKTTTAYSSMQQPNPTNTQAFNNFAQKYDYHCTSWTPDPQMFAIPQ